MKTKDDHTVLLFSIAGGLLVWVADAVVDSLLVPHITFLDSLLFNVSAHDMYSRSLILLGFTVFGAFVQRIQTKHRPIEQRYKDLVDMSNDIIAITDRDAKQVFMNEAAYRILDRTPDEVIGKSFMELLHPEDRGRAWEKFKEISKSETDDFQFENRYVARSGRTITVLQNVRVLRNETGAFIGMQSIARDITERKQSEGAMQKAVARAEDEKARSESILSSIADGISIQDRDFKVMYQNQAHIEISGGDKRGEYCYHAYDRGDSPCPGCPVEKVFKDGKIHSLEKEMPGNSEIRFVEIKASPLMDASGTIVAGIELVRDITARKNAEEKLKMCSYAIEEAMDGMQIIDLDGHIIYSNKAIKEICGFSHEELVGRHVNEMNTDREFASRYIIPKIMETGWWSGELLVVHKEGGTFPVLLSMSLVKGEHGQPIAILSTIQDITERKQAEEIMKRHNKQLGKRVEERTRELATANEKLRTEIADREKLEHEVLKAQKLESLGILAGGIAHDFNNLLASIMGNISLAMLDLTPENSAYRQLEGAEKASLRAQDLTRQLLTFSKGGTPHKKTVAIGDLISEVTGFTQRSFGVKFFFYLPENLWLADVDEGQISQVIHNLIINADQAMPEGGRSR